ncbi:hypothetical protein HF325_006914 [Metschnikowia pulcherrima]|uniref:Uncharacterized protein n=1 Tax=Metschnikowia pulcherrima TaxID=27326 RepID=A0A8H7GLG8_9ASCO|nr:hypothetical protein HF325_006914 [Metschnikowia pulcherrima]
MVEAAKIFEDIKGVFATVNRIETNSGHMTHLNRAQKYAHEHAKWGNLQAELISTSKNLADTFTSTTFGGNYRYPKLNEKSESRPIIVRHPADELQSTASPYRKVLEHGM